MLTADAMNQLVEFVAYTDRPALAGVGADDRLLDLVETAEHVLQLLADGLLAVADLVAQSVGQALQNLETLEHDIQLAVALLDYEFNFCDALGDLKQRFRIALTAAATFR